MESNIEESIEEEGNTLGDFEVEASTISSVSVEEADNNEENTEEDEERNNSLGFILGFSIPFGILFIAVIIIVCIRHRRKREEREEIYRGVSRESQKDM